MGVTDAQAMVGAGDAGSPVALVIVMAVLLGEVIYHDNPRAGPPRLSNEYSFSE